MTTPYVPTPPPNPGGPIPTKPPVPSWIVLLLMVFVVVLGIVLIIRTPAQTTSILTTLLTPLGFLATYWQGCRNAEALVAQHHQMNSRLDQVVSLTAEVAHAKGLAQGLAEGKAPDA